MAAVPASGGETAPSARSVVRRMSGRTCPARRAATLTRAECGRLATAIGESLAEAVRSRGTTFSDFRDLDDRPGEYGTSLLVYEREGKPCRACSRPIRRLVQAGRSSFYCPGFQRPPRSRVR